MQGIYGGSCCCTESPNLCEAWPVCTENDVCDSGVPIIPGYTSIGYPLGPTLYDGPFWVAWHNSVVSTQKAGIDANINIVITKRTVVQTSCGGACGTVDTPKEDILCTDSGIGAKAGCQITEYVDVFQWQTTGKIRFVGGNKDQNPCARQINGEDFPGVPKGPYPYILTDCTRSALNKNNPIPVTSDNVAWWPAENRRVYPRFAGTKSITKSAVPSSSYPQVAACGTSVSVLRCGTTSASLSDVCIDVPITIVPGHNTSSVGDIGVCGDGTHPCHLGQGGVPAACSQDEPNNGALEAAWAIDIKEDSLISALVAMGFTVNKAVGDVATMWVAHTSHGRFRILYGMTSRLNPDDVMKFTDGVQISETHTVSTASAGESFTIKVELGLTPIAWCTQNTRCGCVHSFCENAPSTITVDLYTSEVSGCSSAVLDASYMLALGDYEIPYGAFTQVCGANATPNCMQYPVATPGNFAGAPCGPYYPPTSPGIFSDFVGSHPVERAHAGWVKYRNRYDHYYCINSINIAAATPCCPAPISVGGQNYTHIEASCGTEMDPAWVATAGPCPGANPLCVLHTTIVGTTTECRPVQHYSGSISYSAIPVPSAICHQCDTSFFQCGQMIFTSCGTALYDVCDCCNTQVTVQQHELLIVDWDITESCTPIGTHTLYGGSTGTACNKKNFTEIGYAVVS